VSEKRAALVTGGAGGIGAEIARRLALDGFNVIVADMDGNAAIRVAAPIGSGIALDMTDEISISTAFEGIVATCGGRAVLVNCTGIHLQKLAYA